MTTCSNCGKAVGRRAKREGPFVFCDDKCRERGLLQYLSGRVPEEELVQYVKSYHAGPCPKCNGHGPVDIHNSYWVYSLVVLTSWNTVPQISCRECGVKSQIKNTTFSLACGWWGIPFGFIMTPVQVIRNVVAMFAAPDPSQPSAKLATLLKVHRAALLARDA